MDNYLVRVLAGKSAWELRPGGVGAAELMVSERARLFLGNDAQKLKTGYKLCSTVEASGCFLDGHDDTIKLGARRA